MFIDDIKGPRAVPRGYHGPTLYLSRPLLSFPVPWSNVFHFLFEPIEQSATTDAPSESETLTLLIPNSDPQDTTLTLILTLAPPLY